jgi:hypothetical protein
MNATLAEPMAKKKRDDQSVKIDRQLAEWAGIVAKSRRDEDGRELTVAEYLSELIRPHVTADYREAVEQMHANLPQSGAEPRKRK